MVTSIKEISKKNVTFLSYNLYCLPWLATAFSPSSCPLPSERSSGFLNYIDNYDIICLQEVWDPRYSFIEQHARLTNKHVVGSSAPSSFSYLSLRIFGGGLMIISKYPIVATEEIVFERGTQADRFVTKGVLYAKVKVGSSYIHVFNTHLQASYGYEFQKENPYSHTRKRQLKKLAEFVEKLTSKDEHPIIVNGDFNVNARATPDSGIDSEEYIEMIKILESPHYVVIDILKEHNGGEHPVTYEGFGVVPGEKPRVGGQRLDFMLVFKKHSHSDDINYFNASVVPFKVIGEIYTHISDHYAQTVTMTLDTEKGIYRSDLSQVSISMGAA